MLGFICSVANFRENFWRGFHLLSVFAVRCFLGLYCCCQALEPDHHCEMIRVDLSEFSIEIPAEKSGFVFAPMPPRHSKDSLSGLTNKWWFIFKTRTLKPHFCQYKSSSHLVWSGSASSPCSTKRRSCCCCDFRIVSVGCESELFSCK